MSLGNWATERVGTDEVTRRTMQLITARAVQSKSWRFVRTRGGRTIHIADCVRAKKGTPWTWAAGRSIFDIFLASAGSEWASCCCGFIYGDAAILGALLGRDEPS